MIFKLSLFLTILASSAILLPPLPADATSVRVLAKADPCESLTPKALQQVIDKVAESLAKAESDVIANGTTGKYATSAILNRDYLVEARQKLLEFQSFLKKEGIDQPFVTNASGAYNFQGSVGVAVSQLFSAQHWAMISVANHKSSDAFDSFNLSAKAIDLAVALGAPAGRCYMRSYFVY
ncbi:MAG TPA: hypothetical protein VE956_03695 [Nodularia sp. (in: cyanobacteria)]|nr:hypothetical protein [Nodularia sp. (in: cyanobacteria)]